MSVNVQLKVNISLADVISKNTLRPRLNAAVQASSFIVVNAYKKEMPVNFGTARRSVESKQMNGVIGYEVQPNLNPNYMEVLYSGTGRLKNSKDFGYTPGRIRAGDVAYGIGGIRPNKVADRAKEKSESKVNRYINGEIPRILNEK